MLPSFLKVELDRGMVGESGKSTFGCIVNVFISGASGPDLSEFVSRERVDGVDTIEVRILYVSHGSFLVVVSPGQ